MNSTCYTTTAALVGFEQEEYSVRERESGVEVCLNVQGPPGVILSEPVFVVFELSTQPQSATGMYMYVAKLISITN